MFDSDLKLNQIATVVDCEHKTAPTVDNGIPLIRTPNISRGILDTTNAQRVTPEIFEKWTRRAVPVTGDLIMAREAPVGNVGIVKGQSVCLGQRTVLIQPDQDQVVSAYLNYLFSTHAMHSYLNLLSNGATVGHLNVTDIRKLQLPALPSIEEQQKIAAILTAYDDLIENNRQRIALLEKLAEEIYREWFVRLRFPGHENTPVHKGVPEGWERKVGDELFDTAKGRSYTSNNISDTPTHHDNERPFLTLKSLNRGGGYRRDGLKHYRGPCSDDQIVGAGDVIMAVTDMTQNRAIVGQAARVPALTECEGAAISLDLVCLRPKQWSKNFLYAFCRYSGFASHLAQFANGANVLHLKPSVIDAQKLLSPATGLVEQFDAKTIAIFNLIDILHEEAGELAKTRDLLLNRLISGKLRVDDLDIQFPPSMQEPKAA